MNCPYPLGNSMQFLAVVFRPGFVLTVDIDFKKFIFKIATNDFADLVSNDVFNSMFLASSDFFADVFEFVVSHDEPPFNLLTCRIPFEKAVP